MKKSTYVKIVSPNGNYRYGYVETVKDRGDTIIISLCDEGASKLEFDARMAQVLGYLPETKDDYLADLSDMEKKVATHLATGLSTGEIAVELGILPVTVRVHLRNLRNKMGVENRAQLVTLLQGLEL